MGKQRIVPLIRVSLTPVTAVLKTGALLRLDSNAWDPAHRTEKTNIYIQKSIGFLICNFA